MPNITKVYLLDVPLENDYKNTLYFANASAQQSYFQSCVINSLSYNDFSYQRKDQIIRVPLQYDDICMCNYVMYQNTAYSNKWFYAFVNKVEYINDGRTDLHIETDVMQTWMFDYTVRSSFVEREHVNDDTIGKHTVPEGLETGDYIQQGVSTDEYTGLNYLLNEDGSVTQSMRIVLAVSETGLNVALPSGQRQYNGVYSGLIFLTFYTYTDCDKYIQYCQTQFGADNIYACFILPSSLVNISSGSWLTFTDGNVTFEYAFVEYSNSQETLRLSYINKPTVLDNDYVPRNKKLLTFPYCYLVINNNAGSSAQYMYEYFTDIDGSYTNRCQFRIDGAVTIGGSIKCYPCHYKLGDTALNTERPTFIEGLDGAKLPTASWLNDSYTNWLTQNAVNLPISIISDLVQIGVGIAGLGASTLTGGLTAALGSSAIVGGVTGIANTLGSVYQHSTIPATAQGGVNQGDLVFASRLSFRPYKYSIRKEYAKIIDGFFDMFGYKVAEVKVPNSNHRQRWWYTKTIDANITGNIPQEDLRKIRSVYDNGVTFWRNASEIENYSLSNSIV